MWSVPTCLLTNLRRLWSLTASFSGATGTVSVSYTHLDVYKRQDEYPVTLENGVQVTVQEYEVAGQEDPRYAADFEYRDAQYQLMGHMEKDEFEKIIKNLRFYD